MAKPATPAEIEIAKTLMQSTDDMHVYYDTHLSADGKTVTLRRNVQRKAYRSMDREYLWLEDTAVLTRRETVEMVRDLALDLAYMPALEG